MTAARNNPVTAVPQRLGERSGVAATPAAHRSKAGQCRLSTRALDPISFIETVLVNPETGQQFVLTDAKREFLALALELTPEGRLRHPELVFSAIKKSGKTAFAAMILIYVIVVLGGRYVEGFCCANDFEQSQGRVFTAAARIVEASPLLRPDAIVTGSKIEFRSMGSPITAIASDYSGAAGTWSPGRPQDFATRFSCARLRSFPISRRVWRAHGPGLSLMECRKDVRHGRLLDRP